ncbi:putative Acyl-coenzyme A oxidase 1, peroxisomal [Operophtera brumata]|uniref:Putative Acyl-coenzyme A oxidase 1, peroxisomal n=1 Tax=Operophtera brumata TaxID=104452 RepID=A0A0L7LNZ7_OPEBR|nr:putative Acyl-coenzyme A oxidase 1, peroxisomal [Operophtera brumata]
MANFLALAATVAIRYAAIRRQSQLKPNEPEPQILDFVTQQHKLFIAIATSHAFSLTATWLWDLYSKVNVDLAAGNTNDLPELHAIACCLKAVTSSDAAGLVERCRMSCGGHGYMLSSNLPQMYGMVTAACTYEGENTVMMLQTARQHFILQDFMTRGHFIRAALNFQTFGCFEAAKRKQGKPLSFTMAYLSDRSGPQKWDSSVDGIIMSFQRVAAGKLSSAVTSMKKYIKSGLSTEDAWNKASVQLVAASEAHCRSFILSTYHSEIRRKAASLSAPLKAVLHQLVELYAIYWTLERLGDLLLFTSITESDVSALRHAYEDLLEKIRPNAVGLVDAFDYRDEILNSTLGAYDGRVYERLMGEALKSPLNAESVNQSFYKYLKPLMQGKL